MICCKVRPMHSQKAKNTIVYFLWKFLSGFYFVFPITVIFILGRGLSKEQVTIFLSLTTLATVLLEIPTGYIADRFSRKLSVCLGYFFNAVGHFLLIFLGGFWQLLLVGLFFALNRSLISGAMDALIYDNLVDITDKKSFIKLSSRGASIAFVSGVAASIVGSYMFAFNKELPFVATALVNLLLALLIMWFKEPKKSDEVARNISALDGLKEILKSRSMINLVILNILISGISSFFYTIAFHPKMVTLGLNVKYLGWVDALNSLLLVFVLGFLARLVTKKEKLNLFLYTSIPLIAFVVVQLTKSPLIVIIFGLMFSLFWTSRSHIVSNLENTLIQTKNRALSLSSISLLKNIGAAVITPVYGLVIINNDLATIPLVAFLLAVTIVLVRAIDLPLEEHQA